MRTTLKFKTASLTIGSSLAAVALVANAPLAAQDEMAEPATSQPSDEDMAQIAGWPAERQTAYEMWPAETKSYYWTLVPERQELFWRLSDDDKIALTAMTGPERDDAWSSIEGRSSSPPPEG